MEANTLHCHSCGAAVGEHDLTCPYCGGQLATVACPRCFGMVPVHASHCPNCGAAVAAGVTATSSLDCPDCRVPLNASVLGGLSLDQCGKCGGLWVDQKTFEQIAADRQERGEVMGSLPAPVVRPVSLETVHYRPCPRCGKLMNRQNYAHISGVVINVCKEHGIWFERDELRQVLAFIEAGGLERSRSHELAQLSEERHLAAAAAPLPPVNADWTAFGSEPHEAGVSLASIVESLVGHFFH